MLSIMLFYCMRCWVATAVVFLMLCTANMFKSCTTLFICKGCVNFNKLFTAIFTVLECGRAILNWTLKYKHYKLLSVNYGILSITWYQYIWSKLISSILLNACGVITTQRQIFRICTSNGMKGLVFHVCMHVCCRRFLSIMKSAFRIYSVLKAIVSACI